MQQIHIRINDEHNKWLQEKAQKEYTSVAHIIRQLIIKAWKEEKGGE